MDKDQKQAWEQAVERKKAEAEEASRAPGEAGKPSAMQEEQPGRFARGSSENDPTPHHKSSRHGQVTAENWNQ